MKYLLDVGCMAGGGSAGYARAGFRVTGTDIEPQRNYPYDFFEADFRSLDPIWIRRNFDAIHISPMCKVWTSMKHFSAAHHIDMIPDARKLAMATGLPYVIENVPGAPLIKPLMLCGSMFDQCWIRRHRLFELGNFTILQPECRHEKQEAESPGFLTARYHSGERVDHLSPVVLVYGRGNGYGPGETDLWRSEPIMDIPWAARDEISQAIPPRYTSWIGERLITLLTPRT